MQPEIVRLDYAYLCIDNNNKRQYSYSDMKLAWDPTKDALNVARHKLSLAEAERIEWDTLWAKPDTRREYGEDRMIGLAYIGARLYCVIYVDRGETRRVISLRKANSREVKRYAEA